jgi:asparagine synthase (glutamine-hydrolysing)
MCGILAIIDKNCNEENIIRSNRVLKNRGPDSGNIIFEKGVRMLFRRLAIMDVNSTANQPFVNQKSKLICNGEIYNYKKLCETYSIQCKTNSDCEVIIHLADKIGFPETVLELDGVFATVYYTKTRVYFARDYVGVRPLFYGKTNTGGVAFGSTAMSLQNFCSEIVELEPGWGYYDTQTRILYHEPYKYESLKDKKTSILGFNNIVKQTEILNEHINTVLTNSVRKRLMGDRPMGCLLSGGLDSSLIVSILCRLIGPENVKTFSIGIEGSEDLKNARKVAEFLGTTHTEVNFTPDEGFSYLEDVIRDLETYDITTIRASIPMWMLSKYVKENTDIKILLSGEGADELFCGYLYFHYAPTPEDLSKESARLVENLHKYDVLRADRSVSSHGLELRVPFLDKELVKLMLSLKGEMKMPLEGIEKYLLRNSFKENYLPESVLWRRKDGMSDGVSGSKKRWYEEIQERIEPMVSEEVYREVKDLFPSKEALYYKKIYDNIFTVYSPKIDYWLPKWVDCGGDPSGRIMKVFTE